MESTAVTQNDVMFGTFYSHNLVQPESIVSLNMQSFKIVAAATLIDAKL